MHLAAKRSFSECRVGKCVEPPCTPRAGRAEGGELISVEVSRVPSRSRGDGSSIFARSICSLQDVWVTWSLVSCRPWECIAKPMRCWGTAARRLRVGVSGVLGRARSSQESREAWRLALQCRLNAACLAMQAPAFSCHNPFCPMRHEEHQWPVARPAKSRATRKHLVPLSGAVLRPGAGSRTFVSWVSHYQPQWILVWVMLLACCTWRYAMIQGACSIDILPRCASIPLSRSFCSDVLCRSRSRALRFALKATQASCEALRPFLISSSFQVEDSTCMLSYQEMHHLHAFVIN